MHWLLTLRIDKSSFLVPATAATAIAVAALFVRPPARGARVALWAGAAALLGYGLVVLVVQVLNVFGLPLTPVTTGWIVAAFAGVGAAIASLVRPPAWRKPIAVLAIPLVLVTSAAWINEDFGAYRTVQDALGVSPYPSLPTTEIDHEAGTMDAAALAAWVPPAGMASHGTVGTVDIPATASGFPARRATVYLPPAALTAHPPVLPVIEMFSSQPGSTFDMFATARTQTVLDGFASAHRGLAPVVVDADQLGAPDRNPMCVDSPLGRSATYLLHDVPTWIEHHLAVSDDHRDWAVAGFSQGGTCSIQFGAGHPEIFSSILDISGELAPTIGARTVSTAFHGSASAYRAATPLALLKRNAPFTDTVAVVGVGDRDAAFLAAAKRIAEATRAAGMTTRFIDSPDSGHDWNTVRYVLRKVLPAFAEHLLTRSAS